MATADRDDGELSELFENIPPEMRNMPIPIEKEFAIKSVKQAVMDANLCDREQAEKMKKIFCTLYETSIYRDEFWKNELKKKFNS